MPYGTIKVDNITFDNGGTDKLITVSGLFFSTSGALTVTGTISGGNVTAPTATFTTLTGTTTAGTTATFTSGSFTSLTGVTTTVTSGVFGLGSAAAPSIAFSGDTNNGIYSPGADQVAISTSGTGRLFIDSSGRLLVGTSTARSNLTFGGVGISPLYQVESTGAESSISITRNATNNLSNARLVFAKNNSATLGTNVLVDSGEVLGEIAFNGNDGTNFIVGANITGEVDGTPGANDMPGRLVFSTTADGSASPTERMRLTSAGLLGLGTSSPSGLLTLAWSSSTGINSGLIGQVTNAAGANNGYRIGLRTSSDSTNWCSIDQAFTNLGVNADTYIAFTTTNASNSAAERMRLTSTGLGIGTSVPSDKLHVIGGGIFSTATTAANLLQVRNSDFTSFGYFGVEGPTGGVTVGGSLANATLISSGATGTPLQFGTAGTIKATLDSSGRLGIGTIAPTIQLQVLKDPGANNANNGAINLCRTSTVGSTLYHTYSTAVSDEVFAFSVHGSTTFSDTTYTKYLASAGGVHVWYGATTATERARIDSSGRLLVGTSSDLTGSFLFQVNAASNAAIIKGAAASNDVLALWSSATSGNNIFSSFYTEGTVTNRGAITYNRGAGVVAYNTTSDYRAKTLLGSIEDCGAVIDALKVYRGVMNGATVERPMLIAHEAQEVAPYCVTGQKDAEDDEGNPIYQQMDHQVLVPLLIAEIQQLRARVAALEAQ